MASETMQKKRLEMDPPYVYMKKSKLEDFDTEPLLVSSDDEEYELARSRPQHRLVAVSARIRFMEIHIIFVGVLLLCLAAFLFASPFKPHLFSKFFNDFEENKVEDITDGPIWSSVVTEPNLDKNAQCSTIPDNMKFDCHPDNGGTEQSCLARGCCWQSKVALGKLKFPPLNVPYCYFPADYIGYKVTNISKSDIEITASLERQIDSGFPDDVQQLTVSVKFLTLDMLQFKVFDPNNERYEVPIFDDRTYSAPLPSLASYEVVVEKNGNFIVSRKGSNQNIIDVNLNTIVFADQLLQISFKLPSHYIYGLGEHQAPLLRDTNWSRFTFLNRDRAPMKKENLYGSHPFYMNLEETGTANGVFLLNSNPMDVILQPTPAITFRTIGGVLDFYVFFGPKPADVVMQYLNVIGTPQMPPYWGLGFHLCRFGYNTANETRNVWKRTRDAKIPFDVQWNDIDYMDRHNVFTYDKKKFKELPQFVDEVHKSGMKYVAMFDPGVSGSETPGTYPPFDDGIKDDVFMKNSTGGILWAKVWNSKTTVFPDFTDPKTTDWLISQYKQFHAQVPFDGSWIDMNEPSNFVDGSFDGCPADNRYDHPPYIPGDENPIYTKTACMSAQQYWSSHYNVHNLYGYSHAVATYQALKSTLQKRPFIISRSTFPGQGVYGGHWDGDIYSTWEHMRWTIPSIINFNMFGIPLIGGDICGFNSNTTIELCARWSALGAFYPFSRNHNSDDCIEQDPVALGPVVVSAAKKALEVRYALLPYLYTLFYKAHIYGETVVRPLFFEFPKLSVTYSIDTQFLWGPGLMILPVLEPNVQTVTAYFPPGLWYDYYDGTIFDSIGHWNTLPAPEDHINVVVRGGHILPLQEPDVTTTLSRMNGFILLVALDSKGMAYGDLYWDDGDSLDTFASEEMNVFTFKASQNKVQSECNFQGYKTDMKISSVKVFGVKNSVTSVSVNGQSNKFQWDSTNKVLTVPLDLSLYKKLDVTWK